MKIPFNKDLDKDYRDLVEKLLTHDPKHRLPLIEIFDHSCVRKFQAKAHRDWKLEENDSDSDEYNYDTSQDGTDSNGIDSNEDDSDGFENNEEQKDEEDKESYEYYDEEEEGTEEHDNIPSTSGNITHS